MEEERHKRNGWLARKTDVIIIILALLAIFWTINNNINSVNQRVDGLYDILIKSDKGIVDMKAGIEARFVSIEKKLNTIEIGISSLQPRDDSLKEGESGYKTSPYQEDKPPIETSPYQEGESGQKTTPYISP